MQRTLYFLLMLVGLILCELIFMAAFTGYMPTKIKFLLWENIDFLLVYFRGEPLDTLKFVFIDKPLIVIESRQQAPSTVIWGLHYYSYTVIVHVVIAIVLAQQVRASPPIRAKLRYFQLGGSGLLVFSSLYLYLSSCCTGEASWILHTWFLSLVFNPITATESMIELYELVHNGFIWMQILIAALGACFLASVFLPLCNNRQ